MLVALLLRPAPLRTDCIPRTRSPPPQPPPPPSSAPFLSPSRARRVQVLPRLRLARQTGTQVNKERKSKLGINICRGRKTGLFECLQIINHTDRFFQDLDDVFLLYLRTVPAALSTRRRRSTEKKASKCLHLTLLQPHRESHRLSSSNAPLGHRC